MKRLSILVLSLNYAPEPTGFAPHTTALCEHLVSNGHSVTVVTGFPFAPHWRRRPEHRGEFIRSERIHDVDVLRISHFIPRQPSRIISRLLLESSFCLVASLALLTRMRSNWDVILYIGAQPAIAMLARVLASLRHIPYVVAINDLAAHAAVEAGIVKRDWTWRTLSRFEFASYRRASSAIVLSSGFKDELVAQGYPSERIRIIRSPIDLDLIQPQSREGNSFRESHGLGKDEFLILYSGSMGLKQDLSTALEAARILRHFAPSVRWVLVGEGELKPALERSILENRLMDVVKTLPLQPEAEMPDMFSAADVLFLGQLKGIKGSAIPSKLLTYMAAGRPILAAIHPMSEAAILMREAQAGFIVPPEDPQRLADAVRKLLASPDNLDAIGQRNRAFAEKHFDQSVVNAAQEAVLIEVLEGTSTMHQ